MGNNYTLKFTQIANNDLERIYQYIARHLEAEKAANDLMDEIETVVMRLKDFPYSGSTVIDEILNNRGYRKLIVKNYIVFYLIDAAEKQIVVMRVLYGAQQYENFL